jgi:hypothetical protein
VGARVAFAVAALLATAALAACGGGADGDGDGDRKGGEGHATYPLYGVISAEPLPGGAALTRLGDGGVGTLRVNLAWGYVRTPLTVSPERQAAYVRRSYGLLAKNREAAPHRRRGLVLLA